LKQASSLPGISALTKFSENTSKLGVESNQKTGGDSFEPSFEPSGRNGVENRTPTFWVKEAKLKIA